MSDQFTDRGAEEALNREDLLSARFAQLVMQQSNLALMLLGKVPHPERGEAVRDLEGAQIFIDQLEMLEAKTKGNLNSHEAALLKQSLMTLRLAFVEAVNSPPPEPTAPTADAKSAAAKPADTKEEAPPPPVAEEGQAPKRFSRKFS